VLHLQRLSGEVELVLTLPQLLVLPLLPLLLHGPHEPLHEPRDELHELLVKLWRLYDESHAEAHNMT
jgi:hypothetical protein